MSKPLSIFILIFWTLVLIASSMGLSKISFHSAFDARSILSEQELQKFNDQTPQETLALFIEPKSGSFDPILTLLEDKLTKLPQVESALRNQDATFALLPPDLLILRLRKEMGLLSIDESRELLASVENEVSSLQKRHRFNVKTTGNSPIRVALHDGVGRDLLWVAAPTLVLLWLVPFLIYRMSYFLLLPGIVGLSGVVPALALYGHWGSHFNYFSLTIVPLIFCLALLDSVFLIDEFLVKRNVKEAVQASFFPCSLALGTNLVAFIALGVSSDTPLLREFSLFESIGTLITVLAVFTLLPALLQLLPPPTARRPHTFVDVVEKIICFQKRTAHFAIPATLGVSLFIAACLVYLKPPAFEALSTQIFSKDHPTQKLIHRFQQAVGSPFPMIFKIRPIGSEPPPRWRTVMFTQHFSNWLQRQSVIQKVISPQDLLKDRMKILSAPMRISHPSQLEEVENQLKKIDLKVLEKKYPEWIELSSSGEITSVSIMAWPKPINGSEYETFLRHLGVFNQHMMGEFQAELTGFYPVLRATEKRFLNETTTSFIATFFIISLCVLFWFRSARFFLTFVIVNTLPLLSVFLFAQWLNLPLSFSLIGLPCILFAIIVDDTIHLFWACFRLGSIEQAYREKTRAILVTSTLLIIAFLSQAFSIYTSNRQFGMLAAAGTGIATLCEILLVPLYLDALVQIKLPWRRSSRSLRSEPDAHPSS